MASPSDAEFPCPRCGSALPAAGQACMKCMATQSSGAGTSAPAAFAGPKRVAGYRILRELGAGGMGTVFEAHDEKMDRKVALKVMSRHQAPSAKAGQRFEQEAWIAGKLDHPNLVKVYERGDWEELSYYSMELVDGGSLTEVVNNMKRAGRDDRLGLAFDSRDYVAWAIGQIIAAARGLDYAHRKGVVHRDIKPMNLLFNSEMGQVQIADFGLAIDSEATRLTTVGKVLGTLAYMAPEQMLGKPQEIGAQSDIYALGVTLFELLTLELPYNGNTQQLYMDAVLTVEARRPSKLNEQVSRDLETVIRKALEKRPRDRYGTAGAFAADLENVLRLRPIQAKAPGRMDRLWKWVRRKPVHAALLATLIVSLPTITVLGVRWAQQRRTLTEARVEDLWSEVRWLSLNERYGEVVEASSRLLSVDPEHWRALRSRALANLYLSVASEDAAAAGYAAAAVADIDRVVEHHPQESWSHALKAHILKRLGRPATEELSLAERYRGPTPAEDDLLFDAYLAADQGDHARGIELLTELQVRRPGDPQAIVHRARAYERSGQLERAIQDYRLAVALKPTDAFYAVYLGQALTLAGQHAEAERYLQKALELGTRNAEAYEALAFNLYSQGQAAAGEVGPDAARVLFQRAADAGRRGLELKPDLTWAPVTLAAALLEANRLLPASDPALLREAVDLYARFNARPGTPRSGDAAEAFITAQVNYCDGLIQLDELERAAAVCAGVVALTPDDPVAHYNLAGAHALAGRTEQALAELRRDLQLGDTDWQYLSEDRWFEALQDHPEFRRILAEMRAAAGDE